MSWAMGADLEVAPRLDSMTGTTPSDSSSPSSTFSFSSSLDDGLNCLSKPRKCVSFSFPSFRLPRDSFAFRALTRTFAAALFATSFVSRSRIIKLGGRPHHQVKSKSNHRHDSALVAIRYTNCIHSRLCDAFHRTSYCRSFLLDTQRRSTPSFPAYATLESANF
jgi:hypothetical protein